MKFTIKEYLMLLWLNLVVLQRNMVEYLRVICRYYRNSLFGRCDRFLLWRYRFRNPYRICRRHFQERGVVDPYLYGETPLTGLELIARECHLTASDTLFELGSGRGRASLWLRYFIGCKVVAIEVVPQFVEIAREVQARFHIDRLEFLCEDIAQVDYQGATVIYLYGSSYSDQLILQLIERFKKLPAGTKIITVSYALTEYTQRPVFRVLKMFQIQFTWGIGDVYLQEVVKASR